MAPQKKKRKKTFNNGYGDEKMFTVRKTMILK